MIELAKHIEILLMENDCVIIPEFGGFIAYHKPACYEKEEGVYLPPTRTIGFNPQLTINDGLLTQSYMQSYHTDYSDALKKIAYQVNLIKDSLYKNGYVELSGIGTISYNIYQNYEFKPNTDGYLSPSLYGLDSFYIDQLNLETTNKFIKFNQDIDSVSIVNDNKKQKIIQSRQYWLGNAIAIAIAAILFFTLSTPVENTYIDKGNYASLGTDCLFDIIRSHSMATKLLVETPQLGHTSKQITPIIVKTEKIESNKTTRNENVITENTKLQQAPSSENCNNTSQEITATSKRHYIIVASFATSSDAHRMLQKYQSSGYPECSIIEGSGRFRIALIHYSDKSSVYKKLNELKQKEEFKNAWILTSK